MTCPLVLSEKSSDRHCDRKLGGGGGAKECEREKRSRGGREGGAGRELAKGSWEGRRPVEEPESKSFRGKLMRWKSNHRLAIGWCRSTAAPREKESKQGRGWVGTEQQEKSKRKFAWVFHYSWRSRWIEKSPENHQHRFSAPERPIR